ncbi:MAG: phenylacetate--CoA ligase family protein [Armatimonadetes bacterium]|nr:phenylacetate--CoA ligase family protein [Armatimonadota bacterium]
MLRNALMRGLFAVGSRLVRRQALRELDVLRWAEKADPLELRTRQEARLRALIRAAYDTVPYYRRVMDQAAVSPDDIRGIDDLPLLPVLLRRDIRAHLDALVSTRVSKRDLLRRASSGTAGAPVWFYRDRRTLPFERASLWHDLGWAGVTAADPTLFVRRLVDNQGVRKWTRWNWLVGSAFLPPELLYALAPGPVAEAVERAAPAVIYGYPSLLHLLARAILRSGRPLRTRPRCVLYDAEQMGEDTRDLVRQAIGAPIFSRYGAREFSAGVAKTCEHGRWHLNTEGFVVEVVSGEPGEPHGTPAAKGRLVITDLRNHAMPFVRYEIGDAGATGGQEKCPCGRTLPVLDGLEGRSWEWVVTASGLRIPITMIAPMVVGLHGDLLWEYQFRQDRPEVLEVAVVPVGAYGADRKEELARHLEAALGGGITVRVTPVEHIPREPSGKRPVMKSTLHQGR